MKTKLILIIAGEPKSIFEIFFKSINKTKFKSPLIIIASKIIFVSVKSLDFQKK